MTTHDPLLVQQLLAGRVAWKGARADDRAAAVLELDRQGLSVSQINARLGANRSSVRTILAAAAPPDTPRRVVAPPFRASGRCVTRRTLEAARGPVTADG